jgi:hypothetical protein
VRRFQLSPLAGAEMQKFILAGAGICGLRSNRLRNFGQNSAQSSQLSRGFASEADLPGFMANILWPPRYALFPGKTQVSGSWDPAPRVA